MFFSTNELLEAMEISFHVAPAEESTIQQHLLVPGYCPKSIVQIPMVDVSLSSFIPIFLTEHALVEHQPSDNGKGKRKFQESGVLHLRPANKSVKGHAILNADTHAVLEDKGKLIVRAPPTRSDMLHACDIAEKYPVESVPEAMMRENILHGKMALPKHQVFLGGNLSF